MYAVRLPYVLAGGLDSVARTLKDAKLDTRAARQRLKQRREPYWRSLSEGLGVGYRKGTKGGTWIAKHYSPEHGRRYLALGAADDVVDADSMHVLSFNQAQEAARKWFADLAQRDSGHVQLGPFTVADALNAYIKYLESEGRSQDAINDARYHDKAFIHPKLGEMEVKDLTADTLRTWRNGLAETAPRVRTKPGKPQQFRKFDAADDDARRARRASANRIWTTLRAALNHAFRTDKIDSDKAWRKVKPFKGVDEARVRYLSIAEAQRLINASDPEFRPLIQAALLTGGRYGQLAKLTVGDFNPDVGTVTMRTRKGDGSVKVYHVHLTADGVQFFKIACAARNDAGSLIFKKADGGEWKKSEQARPIEKASTRAKIDPPANFHITRHTWASHAVMNGTPLLVVAKSLGHRDTRMVEKHYGHLAPSYVADAIRAGAPAFGMEFENVASLPGRRARGI
jgi:integrase